MGMFRFIPTCVGNTTCSPCSGTPMAVHPHVRGEYMPLVLIEEEDAGSSPRAWGILFKKSKQQHDDRFIPTCVGNTDSTGNTATLTTVHPHVRGEYQAAREEKILGNGSSPRAWGILTDHIVTLVASRFIPTCVGNTIFGVIPPIITPVHPHVRGEYTAPWPPRRPDGGSSPRAWGILDDVPSSDY